MSPWSPKAYQVLAILENPTFKPPSKGLQEIMIHAQLVSQLIRVQLVLLD